MSPTPPVECLSAEGPPRSEVSSCSPDRSMQSVRSAVSRGVIPWNQTAMRKAAIWYRGTWSAVNPSTMRAIWSVGNSRPRFLASMISRTSMVFPNWR